MTDYTDHPDKMFDVDAPLLASQLLEARDNLRSVVEGDATAPRILPAALKMATGSFSASVASTGDATVTINRHSFFPTFSRDTGGNAYDAFYGYANTSSGSLDAPKIRIYHDDTIARTLSVDWEYLTT